MKVRAEMKTEEGHKSNIHSICWEETEEAEGL
jgi:hypothetical protein